MYNIPIDKYPARIRASYCPGKLFGTAVFVVAVLFAREVPEALSWAALRTLSNSFEYVYVMMTICFVTGALISLPVMHFRLQSYHR